MHSGQYDDRSGVGSWSAVYSLPNKETGSDADCWFYHGTCFFGFCCFFFTNPGQGLAEGPRVFSVTHSSRELRVILVIGFEGKNPLQEINGNFIDFPKQFGDWKF